MDEELDRELGQDWRTASPKEVSRAMQNLCNLVGPLDYSLCRRLEIEMNEGGIPEVCDLRNDGAEYDFKVRWLKAFGINYGLTLSGKKVSLENATAVQVGISFRRLYNGVMRTLHPEKRTA